MRQTFHFITLFLIINFVFFGCKENSTESAVNLPEVTTADVSNITSLTSQCGGTVISDGGATVNSRGVCWSTNNNPTISVTTTTDGTGIGSFISEITGLNSGVTYYVKAYATNRAGTGYGSVKSFTTTTILIPEVTTGNVSNITTTSAQCGGNIASDGGAPLIARGVCWSTSTTPTISDDVTSEGTSIGNFTTEITGLNPGVTYYVRAYAKNSAHTGYGSVVQFTTLFQ